METPGNSTYGATRAWLLLALLVALNVLNFIDRTLPQAFIVDITEELALSYTEFTLISGPLFAIVYALTGLVTGALADKMSRPRLIAVGVGIWSVMTAATGYAKTIAQLAGARALVAVGEATLTPSALSMISNVFATRNQGLATSIYYLGISLGAGAAYLVAGSLGPQIGWRGCFILLGVIGIALALLCLFFSDPRSAPPRPASAGEIGANIGVTFRALFSSQALGLTWLAAVLLTFSQGASVLDQAWLVNELGMQRADAQNIVGLIFTTGSIGGAILGGLAADWSRARWAAGRIYFFIAGLLLVLPASIALRFQEPNTQAFLALMLIACAGFTLFYGAIMPAIQELAPDNVRATLVAATILGMALLGTALGNVAAGVLADVFASAGSREPIRNATILIHAVGFLALPCLVQSARRYRAATENAPACA